MNINLNNINLKIEKQFITGVFWKILSCAAFASINIIVRYISGASLLPITQPLPVFVIIFFQHLISTMLILALLIFKDLKYIYIINKLITSKLAKLHIIRVTIATLGLGIWYFSFSKIPVVQVLAISFVAPVITTIGAIILLRERLSINRYIVILFSMLGMFLISRPDLNINLHALNWTAILPIIAALIFSADKLITKKLFLYQECPMLVTFYLLLLITPISLIFVLLTNSWVMPTIDNLLILFILAILSAIAHFAFNKSLETADITLIMPYGITKIIFSAIFSYLIFKEIPQTFNIWLGIIIICLGTILLMYERKPKLLKN